MAELRDADLSEADMRSADLCDADLRGADLRGADLRGTLVSGADFREVSAEAAAPPTPLLPGTATSGRTEPTG